MASLLTSLTIEHVVRRTGRADETKIFSGDRGGEVGTIRRRDDLTLVLTESSGRRWLLDPRIMGEIEPFSLTVYETNRRDDDDRAASPGESSEAAVTIRRGLFEHRGRHYMFSGVAADADPREFMLGRRYVVRLDKFPFAKVQDVDFETMGRLRRYFRGVIVGELSGLGSEGHRVKLAEELGEISLILSASSYVLYSTA